MRIGLVIYGSLDILSGGYLYDRMLVSYLENQGDHVEIISLPVRDYSASLADNLSGNLIKRLAALDLDILLEDELTHPSLFWLNARLRRRVDYPVLAIVHHLRSSEPRAVWANWFYRWVERRYLSSVDGLYL